MRVCAFPGCGNIMKRYLCLSFHRLPVRNRQTLPLWLVALHLDPSTTLKTLREKDHRVCSEHFDEDDYTEKSVKCRHLKANAIPKAKRPAADMEGTTSSHVEQELAAHPQSTPQSTPKKDRPGVPTTFRLVLSSPQTSQQQRTKPSTSGIYIARPPSWKQAEQAASASTSSVDTHPMTSQYTSEDLGAAAAATTTTTTTPPDTVSEDVQGGNEELDLSTEFGEMSVQEDPLDSSYAPSSGTPQSSQESLSGSTSVSGNGNGGSNRRWLVNETNLLELFTLCRVCGAPIDEKKKITEASQIRVQWSCLKNCSGEWSSCPNIRGMAENNLYTSAAIFFTGTTHTTVNDWAKLLHTAIPQRTQFYRTQNTYLIPAVQDAYQIKHEQILQRLIQISESGEKVQLCGDARCDSPGFSAKYCTYSFMDDATKEIVHFEFLQVSEANSSVAMEVMGFQRGLDYLLQKGVAIGVVTTDRSPSIRKLMKDNYSTIRHELDPWHVSKSVKKKVVALSKRRENQDLQPWVKAITNHIYWSCLTSKGDKEDCARRWKSILYHICGVHRWEDEDGVQRTCGHPPLVGDLQKRKKWLKPNSPALLALTNVVVDKRLLEDFRQMALFKQTGSLEVFHSVMLKYAEKRLHFWYDGMRARTQLAILDHNSNVGRPVATTKEGKPKDKKVFSRQTGEWVSKPMYERTTQVFRDDLMERVLKMREDSTIVYSRPLPRHPRRGRRLLCNIAPVPRPDASELVARARSRYMNLPLSI